MMKQPSAKLADTPLFSHVEATEIVRRMPVIRRVAYILLTTGGMLLGLLLTIALSSVAAALLLNLFFGYTFVIDGQLALDNLIMFAAFPVSLSVMLALGMSAQDHGESIKPGESLGLRVRQAVRHGLVSGVVVGLVFGFLWQVAVYIGAIYVELNTMIDPNIRLGDFALYSAIMALAVAPLLALYRGFLALLGPVMLDRLRRQ